VRIVFELLLDEGLCLGSSSGINVAGAIRLARDLGPGHTIVTVLCDSGLRYQSRLFNPQFLRSKDLPVPEWLERKAPPDWRGAYERAFVLAQQGNSAAILHLSDLYASPATGFADAAESQRLFDCALRLGAPRALVRRGVQLAARGKRPDGAAAVSLLERAAALGDLEGLGRLADLVEAGRQGWPAAPAAGREIRQLCADAGGHACQYALAGRMEAAGDARGAYFWLEVLASRPLADRPRLAAGAPGGTTPVRLIDDDLATSAITLVRFGEEPAAGSGEADAALRAGDAESLARDLFVAAHDDHGAADPAVGRRLCGRYAGHPAVSALGRDSRGSFRLLPGSAAV